MPDDVEYRIMEQRPKLTVVPDSTQEAERPATEPQNSANPEALWGLTHVANYLGRSRETVGAWWRATRARAADPTTAVALDALPEPDFVIPGPTASLRSLVAPRPAPYSAQRNVHHDKPWWGMVHLRPLWRPQTIAEWALATGRPIREGGRLSGALGGQYRLPVPMDLRLPTPPQPLRRTLDQIVTIPAENMDRQARRAVHVRVWEGPLLGVQPTSAQPRTVVVLTFVGDGLLPPLTRVDDPANYLVSCGLIQPEQARRGLWFILAGGRPVTVGAAQFVPQVHYVSFQLQPGPGADADVDTDDAELPWLARAGHRVAHVLSRHRDRPARPGPFSNPRPLSARLSDIDGLIGEHIELYPEGTCTAETVARWASGERPVQLLWDPDQVSTSLEHLPVLASTAGDGPEHHLNADADSVVLRAAAHRLALHVSHARRAYQLRPTVPPDRLAVHRHPPTVDPDLEDLLVSALHADPDADMNDYNVGTLLRDLVGVRNLASRAEDSRLTAALQYTGERIAEHYRQQALTYAAEHGTLPVLLRTGASAAQPDVGRRGTSGLVAERAAAVLNADELASYLRAASWEPLRAVGHDDETSVLIGLLYPHERDGLRFGRDTLGRSLIHSPREEIIAVAWPLNGRPDETTLPTDVAPLRLVRMADGLIDLEPLDVRLTPRQREPYLTQR